MSANAEARRWRDGTLIGVLAVTEDLAAFCGAG
jgi:hypothetical protein